MRGIKVGNMLVFRGSAVCIINEIIKVGEEVIIAGTDCNNIGHKGTIEDWEPIFLHKDKLLLFEEKIFNNIISSREG